MWSITQIYFEEKFILAFLNNKATKFAYHFVEQESKIKCESRNSQNFSNVSKTYFTKADSYLFGSIAISKQTLIPSW